MSNLRSFHRNHGQHISMSEMLLKDCKQTAETVLEQIKNLDKDTSDRILTGLTNRFVGNMFQVIYDLQNIMIKTDNDEKNNIDLEKIVQKLSQYCNEIVQRFHNNPNILKSQLKLNVRNILIEAEFLLKVIIKDDFHDFKHELVENLKEILYAVHIIQATIKVCNYNLQQLVDVKEEIQKEFFEDILKIEHATPEALKEISVHIRHTCKHNFQLAYHLIKIASNYDEKIELQLLESARKLNAANFNFLFETDKTVTSTETTETLRKASIDCWNSLVGLFNLIDDKSLANRSKNLRDVVIYVVTYGMVINNQIGKIAKLAVA